MHLPFSFRRSTTSPPAHGFGLIQVLVLLLLISSALAAAAVLLQSRRNAERVQTQESSLRWADEAVYSFAAANARLPCPAKTMGGDEDCSDESADGWLPLQTLAGAAGAAPGLGPLRYAVYRGTASNHLDLTQPLNAYQPLDLQGEPRTFENDDETKGSYDSVNGLDFCQALGLATANAGKVDTSLSSTRDRNALPVNIAYGIVAAGPDSSASGRFDADNNGGVVLESPWRRSDAGYDDRVRVQTFADVAHAVGCRQISDASINKTPYNISTASVDALAASLTLHDSVADLQDNNIGNADAAVRDASFAQAMSAAQVLLAAGHIADTVSSNITDVADLIRAIGTCIASLGTMCWEVPIKAAAIAMEIGSIISYGAALGVNIGTVSLSAKALNATITVRERAKNAVIPPVQDVGEAADKVCTSAHGGYVDKHVLKLDADGNPIAVRDAQGKQVFDENGVPKYEGEDQKGVWQDGLEQQMKQAKDVYDELAAHRDDIQSRRLAPFSDGQIRNRIDSGKSINLHNGRYKMTVCEGKSGGDWHNVNGTCIKRYDDKNNLIAGGYEPVERFKWNVAIDDAIAKRKAAEAWADANRAVSEAEEVLKLARDNYKQWQDTLLPAMVTQKDQDCAKAESASTVEEQKRFQQVCRNDIAAITYTQTCEKTETVKQADGSYAEVKTMDDNPDSSCMPRLKAKVDTAQATRDGATTTLNSRKSAYDAQPAPYLNYPQPDWSWWNLVEDGKTPLGNPAYKWKQNPARYNPATVKSEVPPFYFVDEHELLRTNTGVAVINCIFQSAWTNGTLCQHYPYSRAYSDYQTAKIAADKAETNYRQLEEQYTMMSSRCEALKQITLDGANGACQVNLVLGTEAILRLADQLGSVGAALPPANSTPDAVGTCPSP